MKKIILFIVTCLVTAFTSFGAVKIDSSAAITTTTASASDTNFYKEQFKSIKLASGKVLNDGYDVMVQQQKMYAYMYLSVGILCLLSTIGFFIFYTRISKEKPNSTIPAILCLIIALMTMYSFSNHFQLIFQGIFNPDYAAIKDIISLVKSGVSR